MSIKPEFWPARDTPEVLKYSIDWTKRLAGATILTSQFTLQTPMGLEIVGSATAHDDTTSTIKLKGGEGGDVAEILCIITTSDDQTMDELVQIRVGIHGG